MTVSTPSRLTAHRVDSVMAHGLVTCAPAASAAEVAALMDSRQIHAVLVDSAEPLLITAMEVVRAVTSGEAPTAAAIAGTVPSVAIDATLHAAAEQMLASGDGHVVVRDAGAGAAVGVVSSFDVAAVLAGHDPRVARIVRPAPARAAVSGGRLDQHRVREVMHRGLVKCAPGATISVIAAALVEHRTHAVVLEDHGRCAFVSDLHVVGAALRGAEHATVLEPSAAELSVVEVDDGLDLAARMILRAPSGHLVVVDADGTHVGVVSASDIVGVIGADA